MTRRVECVLPSAPMGKHVEAENGCWLKEVLQLRHVAREFGLITAMRVNFIRPAQVCTSMRQLHLLLICLRLQQMLTVAKQNPINCSEFCDTLH